MKELLNDWHHLFILKGGDFASTYNKLTSNEASYHKALTEITDAIHDIPDVHFLVIKS
ncbi:hypothetical protein [Gilliamella sp. wkB7]|uniref:hypothetical protein n=1 Tax=Gilliamella sp. wkB7 TaxID=3120264 RepID=UPI00159F20B1|nr:hypothetical protein [Gilliamella apicola]